MHGARARLNFVVTGEIRSGTSVVQTALDAHSCVVCHGNLLHSDENVCRAAHESYFGPGSASPADARVDWFTADTNAYQYLTHSVFDRALRGESACGVRILYDRVRALDLFDLLDDRCREGDFCLIHVRRNPAACYVSLRQALASGVWSLPRAGRPRQTVPPSPVLLDSREMTEFVRESLATAVKIARACSDVLEVKYEDLVFDYRATMTAVLDFLEVPVVPLPLPAHRRLPNRIMSDRVVGLADLTRRLPSDVRSLLEDNCF